MFSCESPRLTSSSFKQVLPEVRLPVSPGTPTHARPTSDVGDLTVTPDAATFKIAFEFDNIIVGDAGRTRMDNNTAGNEEEKACKLAWEDVKTKDTGIKKPKKFSFKKIFERLFVCGASKAEE